MPSRRPGFIRNWFAQDGLGFSFIMGLVFFPFVLGLYGAGALDRDSGPLWLGVGCSGLGWLLAWLVVLRAHRRRPSGGTSDLTPWAPLIGPIVLMLVGVIAPLASL